MCKAALALADKKPFFVAPHADAVSGVVGIAAKFRISHHVDDRQQRRMSASSAAHLLSKSVDVFTSTYAYTDGLLAMLQHTTTLFVTTPPPSALVDRARLVGLLSQTRAANRFMGTINSIAWYFAVSAEPVPRSGANVQAALWLRALNQVKGRLRLFRQMQR